MPGALERLRRVDPRLLVDLFVVANLSFLSLDICLAHSYNGFGQWAEWLPLGFSIASPVILIAGLIAGRLRGHAGVDRMLGLIVGLGGVALGVAGLIFHLQDSFFAQQTLRNLVYTAPFVAPLAYAGLGLLLILNRTDVGGGPNEWAGWVLLLALGGFFGNYVLSLADHAQNGFFNWQEWIPVFSSALAVGFLTPPLLINVGRAYWAICVAVLAVQAAVGVLGFLYHGAANLHGPSTFLWNNFVYGAPIFAPLLFPNLVVLAGVAIWVRVRNDAVYWNIAA